MGINEKLKVDLYAVLLVQNMWSLYILFTKVGSSEPMLIIIIIASIIATILIHIIFVNYISTHHATPLKKIKYYFFMMLFFDTIILFMISSKIIAFLTIVITLFAILIIKKKIREAIKIKRYDNKSPVRYLVLITAALIGTYTPILGISMMYLTVNLACIYVYCKYSIQHELDSL